MWPIALISVISPFSQVEPTPLRISFSPEALRQIESLKPTRPPTPIEESLQDEGNPHTSNWQFRFTGTRENIVEMASLMATSYEYNLSYFLTHGFEPSMKELFPTIEFLFSAWAVLYGDTKEAEYAQRYKNLMLFLAKENVAMFGVHAPQYLRELVETYIFMKQKGVFTEAEQKIMEYWFYNLVTLGYRFGNQEAWQSRFPIFIEAIKEHFPVEELRAAIPKTNVSFLNTWHWRENAPGYARIWFTNAYYYAKYVRPELLLSENFKKAAEFFLAQWTPNGLHPCYGNHDGAQLWGDCLAEWIAAHVLNDGRFKWIAIKAEQYFLENDIDGYNGRYPFAMWTIADDALKPVKPDIGCVALKFDDGYGDKFVFRDGWEDDSAYMLVNLCGTLGHAHPDQNSISLLLSERKVWLGDTPYLDDAMEHHNELTIDSLKSTGGVSTITVFQDFPKVAFGSSLALSYCQSNFDWERAIIFVKESYFLFVDSVLCKEEQSASVVLRWHLKGAKGEGGDSRHFLLTQNMSAFEVFDLCQGIESKLEPFGMPVTGSWAYYKLDNSWATIYWGKPMWRLTQRASKAAFFAGDVQTWVNLFSPVRKSGEKLQAEVVSQLGRTVGVEVRGEEFIDLCGLNFAHDATLHTYAQEVTSDADCFLVRRESQRITLSFCNATFLTFGNFRVTCDRRASADITVLEGQETINVRQPDETVITVSIEGK